MFALNTSGSTSKREIDSRAGWTDFTHENMG